MASRRTRWSAIVLFIAARGLSPAPRRARRPAPTAVPSASPASWDSVRLVVAPRSPHPSRRQLVGAGPVSSSPSPGIHWTQVVGGSDVLLMDVVAFPGGVVAVGGARGADRAPSPGAGDRRHGRAGDRVGRTTAAAYLRGSRRLDLHVRRSPAGSRPARRGWRGAPARRVDRLEPAGDRLPRPARDHGRSIARGPWSWRRRDGVSWTPATVPATPSGSTGIILRDVVAHRRRGRRRRLPDRARRRHRRPLCSAAAIWRSADDGRSWGPPELPDGPASVSQVMALADGWEPARGRRVRREDRLGGAHLDIGGRRVLANGPTVEAAGADSVDHVVVRRGRMAGRREQGRRAGDPGPRPTGATWRLQPDMPGAQRVGDRVPVADGLVAHRQRRRRPGRVDVAGRRHAGTRRRPTSSLQDPEMAVVGDRIVAVGREGAWISDPITPGLDIR